MDSTPLDNLKPPRFETGKPFLVCRHRRALHP